MLAENQVKRVLKHCEKVVIESKHDNTKENAEGWCQALRLVLERNTYPISNAPLDVPR